MAKKTHPHKRSGVRRAAKRKPSAVLSWTHRSRTNIALAAIGSALLATGSLAYWKVSDKEVVAPVPVTSEPANKAPVKDVSTLSEKESADIPPEAFHPQPPMPAGYNAHSSALPPGALPAGVVLPGMSMMQGARTSAQGYGDGVRQQFTGKERDNETGLDYFGARYYSSAQGRFTSIDPDNYQARRDLTNPQSWNAYAYVNNNPLSRNDPDGRGFWEKLKNFFDGYGWRSNGEVQQMEDKWRNWLREQEKRAGGTLVYCPGGCGPGSKGYKVNINALSRNEVLRYSASLRESLENNTVQRFSSDEIEKMTQVISLTVAPQHVQDALSTIKRTGDPPNGYRGGDPFQNNGRDGGQVLPKTDTGGNPITYREYDVQPYQQGVNRGAERIVRGSDGSTWYTADHYKTFARVD